MIELVRAANPGPFTLDGTNTWILDGEVVFDPGPPLAEHVEAILRAAPGLSTIFITHRHGDHAPAAPMLKARSGARVIAPEGVGGEVDERVSDGKTYSFASGTVEAIATPGHTAEHFCFLIDSGDVVTGDTILGEGTSAIFPPDGHMGDYLASLRKLRDRAPRRILPGHGPARTDPFEWISYYIDHRLERERQVVEALHAGALDIPSLRERVYPELHPGLHPAAEAQMLAHLIHLEEQCRVVRDGERYLVSGGGRPFQAGQK